MAIESIIGILLEERREVWGEEHGGREHELLIAMGGSIRGNYSVITEKKGEAIRYNLCSSGISGWGMVEDDGGAV